MISSGLCFLLGIQCPFRGPDYHSLWATQRGADHDVEGDPLLYVTITHPDFAIRFSNLFEDGDHNIQLTYDDRDNMVGEFTGDFVKFMSWLTEHGGVDGMRAAFEEAKAEYQPN
jgi:hypothetical protein